MIDRIIGNCTLTGILIAMSGERFTVRSGALTSNFSHQSRAELVGPQPDTSLQPGSACPDRRCSKTRIPGRGVQRLQPPELRQSAERVDRQPEYPLDGVRVGVLLHGRAAIHRDDHRDR